MRLTKRILAVFVSAALMVVGAPLVAQATDLPVIHRAHSDFAGDRGTLLVTVSAPAGITSVRAEVAVWVTGEKVAVTEDFVLRSGSVTNGVWATTEPLLLTELGSYRVHVEVTDGAGNQVRRDNAGTLSYLVVTAFSEIVIDRDTVTYEERFVTVSGVLTGRWPGTGEVQPLAGFRVLVNSAWDGVQVTTAADGSFHGSAEVTTEHDFVFAEYPYDNSRLFFLSSSTELMPIGIDPRPTRLTLRANPWKLDRGESTTLTARLEWKTGDGWEPLPHKRVGVLFCTPWSCSSVGYPDTDAEGRLSLTAEPFQTGYYQVGHGPIDEWGTRDPFVANARATADVVVRQPAEFAGFTAARDPQGHVVVSGHLRFGNYGPIDMPVEIQFSPSGNGAWRTVTTVQADPDRTFYAEVDEPRSGYWRAYYPGSKDFFQSAVSEVLQVTELVD